MGKRDGDFEDFTTYHSIEYIDNKYKDKETNRNTYYGFGDRTEFLLSLTNSSMSDPFPYTEEHKDPRL